MSNSLSSQIKKDRLISLYDLFPVVLHELQEGRIHHLCWSQKQGPNSEQKEVCQTFNNQLSLPASLEWPPVRPGQASVHPKCKGCLTGLSFPRLSLPPHPILPLPPTQILQVDLIFHVSHWVSGSQSAAPSQTEKSSSWKAVCPQRGKEKQVDLIELPNKVYLWTSLEQMSPCNCSHHLLMSHHGDIGKQIGLKTWFSISWQWHPPPPASLARQHMTHSFLLTSKVLQDQKEKKRTQYLKIHTSHQ